jgi:hypothetical protein
MAQESKALEDKLGMLKDQLSDLRTSIKVLPPVNLYIYPTQYYHHLSTDPGIDDLQTFETEFDARLDACLQVNHVYLICERMIM